MQLEQRIEALERENRRLKRAAGGALVVGLGVVFMSQSPARPKPEPEVIRARKFEVVAANSKTRATLMATSDGLVSLSLFDKEGRLRADLGVEWDGAPSLRLSDAEGTRAQLSVTEASDPFKPKKKSKPASLVLFRKDGRVAWRTQ